MRARLGWQWLLAARSSASSYSKPHRCAAAARRQPVPQQVHCSKFLPARSRCRPLIWGTVHAVARLDCVQDLRLVERSHAQDVTGRRSRRSMRSRRSSKKLSDADLRARTEMFRKQLADGQTLDDLLVPAFATVREAAKRALGQRHFDVQLLGGMVLHSGNIAEMKTGEGKTLVATAAGLPQRARRPRRARRHRQRLPRQARLRVDGRGLQVPRPHRRLHRARSRRRAAPRRLRLRRHLRHQQRVRLRLPARQHEDARRRHGPVRRPAAGARRPRLRDRRRGRLRSSSTRRARRSSSPARSRTGPTSTPPSTR